MNDYFEFQARDNLLMSLPISIYPKCLSTGSSNSEYHHCMAITYYHGQQIIAYGSANLVVIVSNTLNLIKSLDGHRTKSVVTAIAWAPFSGRLSSCSTANDIFIWEPTGKSWVHTLTIKLESVATCVSWSVCDQKFCVCTDQFMIFNKEKTSRTKYTFSPIFVNAIKTIFCSFSRDSRFILTLQDSNRDVFVWHKRSSDPSDYGRIPLYHPSPVLNMRWRTSDKIHERGSFMTLAKDHVVRIWTETGVNETLAFNVVTVIPASYGTVSAAFITTSSRMIRNNPTIVSSIKKSRVDSYAYGHGHLPLIDDNYRKADTPTRQEMRRNRSWLLTIDDNHKIYIWELFGISLSVRRTPTLSLLRVMESNYNFVPDQLNQLYAVCRLESEFSHFQDPNFVGRPVSISMTIQNQVTKMIESIDVSLTTMDHPVKVAGRTQGHLHPIRFIRIHHKLPLLMTIDSSNIPFIWEYDDTDVFDPTVLTKFALEVKPTLFVADWMKNSSHFVGLGKDSFYVFEVPPDPSPTSKLTVTMIPTNIMHDSIVIDMKVCFEIGQIVIIVALFTTHMDTLVLNDKSLSVICSTKGSFTYGTNVYISNLFPLKGSTVFFSAENNGTIHAVILCESDIIKGSYCAKSEVVLCVNEPVISVEHAHPCFLFIVTKKKIVIAWRQTAEFYKFCIIQELLIDYKPLAASCIPSGMLAISSQDKLHIYHPIRKKASFPHTNSEWVLAGVSEINNITTLKWSLDGILIVASDTKLYAFTKYMDSFLLRANHIKYPTVHHSLSYFSRGIYDFHPSSLIPLLISGRFGLLEEMFLFLLERYDDQNAHFVFSHRLFNTSREHGNGADKKIEEQIGALKAIHSSNPFPELTEQENSKLSLVFEVFCKLKNSDISTLDSFSSIIFRACQLGLDAPLPFDMIWVAKSIPNKLPLINKLDLSNWEIIEKCGFIYWVDTNEEMLSKIVPIAISIFETKKYLSILLLTIAKRFLILQRLFSKSGDDTRAQFFVRDFSKEKDRKFAEKNAYSALSKHDYHVAAAMFYLANDVDSLVSVILKSIKSFPLAYFACRCIDNGVGKYTTKLINEVFIVESDNVRDLAAKEFFRSVLVPHAKIDIKTRMIQHNPGFLEPLSVEYGDLRFNSCEVLPTNLIIKTDFVKTLFFSGHYLLAVQYLPYFDSFEVPSFRQYTSYTSKPSFSRSFSFDIAPLTDLSKSSSNFGNLVDESLEEDDSDYSQPKQLSQAPLFKSIRNSQSHALISPHKENNTIIGPLKSTKEKKSESSSSTDDDDLFGISNSIYYGGTVDSENYSDYSDNNDDPQPLLMQSPSIINVNEDTNWLTVVIVFNICRYRLEMFLDTQIGLSINNKDLYQIHPEIIQAGKHTASMLPQLHNHLIRSCKRHGFIYRRLLFLSSNESKYQYILELCQNLSLVPDQMLSFSLSSQQITQIAQTAKILMLGINNQLIPFSQFENFEFIVASIVSSLFMYAFYYQDASLMKLILELDLKSIKSFPPEIISVLQITTVTPGGFTYETIKGSVEHDFFSFISADMATQFYVDGMDDFDDENLYPFAVALMDFLLVDTFLRNISNLRVNSIPDFEKLYIFWKKLHDIYLQLFQYATLNFNVFIEINSLSSIRVQQNESINQLLSFLLDQNNRTIMIPQFCRNLLNKFSDSKLEKYSTSSPTSHLTKSQQVVKFKSELKSLCMNPSGKVIIAATANGVQRFTSNIVELGNSNSTNDMISIIPDFYQETSNIGTLRQSSQLSRTPLSLDQTSIAIHPTNPTCVIAHPREPFALIGDYSGQLWAQSFAHANDAFFFDSPISSPCLSLATSYDGSILASGHGHEVLLYSMFLNTQRKSPYSRYDIWGTRVRCLDFVRGSGLFVVGQSPSNYFKSTISFWDSLLPNNSAMIASLKCENAKPESMKYSMRYSALFVGCSDGKLHTIDTRMFKIRNTIKAHDRSIKSLKIDETESYCITGSIDGKMHIWDMKKGDIIHEFFDEEGSQLSVTTNSYPIVGLEIYQNTIFSGHSDGSIYAIDLNQ